MIEVVALSGGKDSTALAMRLHEIAPNPERVYLCTPTGDELPDVADHWRKLERWLGRSMTLPQAPTLRQVIDTMRALPSHRMRFCTRMIKIQPCIAWIRQQKEPVRLMVGLRADEEERQGLYSHEVETVFPLREWGWGLREVTGYLAANGICVPPRTDCARCPYQRLSDWFNLWMRWPEIYQDAAEDEERITAIRGRLCTFRSPERDKWPQSLAGLRVEFERGKVPHGADIQADMFGGAACRVCRM
jgi:hypothetical protein